MELFSELNLNRDLIETKIGESDDVVFFSFSVAGKDAVAIYVDSITDKELLGLEVLARIEREKEISDLKKLSEIITLASVKIIISSTECIKEILNGNAVIFIDGQTGAISVDLKKYETRSISEPPTGFAIKGPRNGFTETIKTNLSLIRRYLKSEKLRIENFEIGTITSSSVSLLYIDGIAKKQVTDKIRRKLNEIVIDGVPDSSYVAKFLNERKNSLFKQVGTTERPDVFIERLLEGRVGILVDGSPFALTLPYMLIEDFQSAEDYYISSFRANLARGIRVVSLAIAIFLPAFFVSAQLFHIQLLPLNFLLTIVNGIRGIPLSPSLEMFFILLIFEILNETSVRMPKYVGMAIGVVGALVLGETVVHAGIVSTPAVLIMALSGICIYTVPDIVESTSVLRLLFLMFAGSIGVYGIIVCFGIILIYLSTIDNYGSPYLAPYSPLISNDLQDGITMKRIDEMLRRPESIGSPNKIRSKTNE